MEKNNETNIGENHQRKTMKKHEVIEKINREEIKENKLIEKNNEEMRDI